LQEKMATRRRIVNSPKKQTKKRLLSNHEIVVLAAYLAGAQSASADTEDIAIKANALAPGRFSWRKYKDQINIDTVRKRLWDASKPEKGSYLIGSEKSGWRLTKPGFDFAKKKLRGMKTGLPNTARASQNERAAQTRELRRMTNEEAFRKYSQGMASSITKSEAERFFRVDDYVTGKTRAAKIERFKIAAARNQALSAAIDYCATLVGEK
jgi:hypothetical protein